MTQMTAALRKRLTGRHKVPFLLYNAQVNRDPKVVARFIQNTMTKYQLKVALLQEVTGYERALEAIPGFTCYQYTGGVDTGNVAILVQDRMARAPFLKRFKTRWWGAKNRRWRAPRSLVGVRAYGIRWASIHRVPYQDARDVNLRANREIDQWLIRRFGKVNARVLVGGDINDAEDSPEVRHLRREGHFETDSLGGIDFVLYKGPLEVHLLRRLEENGGSDHQPKIGIAVRKRRTLRRRDTTVKAA